MAKFSLKSYTIHYSNRRIEKNLSYTAILQLIMLGSLTRENKISVERNLPREAKYYSEFKEAFSQREQIEILEKSFSNKKQKKIRARTSNEMQNLLGDFIDSKTSSQSPQSPLEQLAKRAKHRTGPLQKRTNPATRSSSNKKEAENDAASTQVFSRQLTPSTSTDSSINAQSPLDRLAKRAKHRTGPLQKRTNPATRSSSNKKVTEENPASTQTFSRQYIEPKSTDSTLENAQSPLDQLAKRAKHRTGPLHSYRTNSAQHSSNKQLKEDDSASTQSFSRRFTYTNSSAISDSESSSQKNPLDQLTEPLFHNLDSQFSEKENSEDDSNTTQSFSRRFTNSQQSNQNSFELNTANSNSSQNLLDSLTVTEKNQIATPTKQKTPKQKTTKRKTPSFELSDDLFDTQTLPDDLVETTSSTKHRIKQLSEARKQATGSVKSIAFVSYSNELFSLSLEDLYLALQQKDPFEILCSSLETSRVDIKKAKSALIKQVKTHKEANKTLLTFIINWIEEANLTITQNRSSYLVQVEKLGRNLTLHEYLEAQRISLEESLYDQKSVLNNEALTFFKGDPQRGMKQLSVMAAIAFVLLLFMGVFFGGNQELTFWLDRPALWIRPLLLTILAFGFFLVRREPIKSIGVHFNIIGFVLTITVMALIGLLIGHFSLISLGPDVLYKEIIFLLIARGVGESLFYDGIISRSALIDLKSGFQASLFAAILYGFTALTYLTIMNGSYGLPFMWIAIFTFVVGLPVSLSFWKTKSLFTAIFARVTFWLFLFLPLM